ncbi:MAG: hypothetical protein ACK6BG_15840 [Cyanobacteriota bacterium]
MSLLFSPGARAIVISPSVIKDNPSDFTASWVYNFASDPSFLTAATHQLAIPSLTNWRISSTSWSQEPLGSWEIGIIATHITNPHPSDTQPAGTFNDSIFLDRPPAGYASGTAAQGAVIDHPSNHYDAYFLTGDIKNAWSYGFGSPVISEFRVDIDGRHIESHIVPGPLPILALGAVFGYSRKLRKLFKSSKPEVISTTAV